MKKSARMAKVSLIMFSFLLSTALSAPVKVNEDSMTLFHGEDFHILLPSLGLEVTFLNRSSPRSPSVVLMRGGSVVSQTRAKLNRHLSHLVIDAVGEGDEGVYTVKNPENPEDIKRITLIVRDCSNEQTVIYGENYHIPLSGVTPPITLEYKSIAVEANQTSRPALVLMTFTGLSRDGYQSRISVNDRYVSLSAVSGADEGSYTVRDAQGTIQRKVCLNVREQQNFVKLPHGKRLKINLILNSSMVNLYYRPEYDNKPRLLLDKGEFTSAVAELNLEDRLSVEGSLVLLDQVKNADAGQFTITDILGFTVSSIHLEIQPYKLESLYVAIIALLGVVVFLLLVCLLSCLIKVKKRAKRAAALEKIAQKAGGEDEGEAFRQVVKNITKLSEESKHSQADNTEKSQSTEVDIKGLEVSSKEVGVGNLETSDSGVGFNTALPLDTDTDVPDPISESVAETISVAPAPQPSPPSAPESKPSAPPAIEIKLSPVAESKACPTPETKKTPDQPVEIKLDVSKPADVKLSPAPSPEPKLGLSPADPKPAPSPSPEPKAAAPKAPTPNPEIKSALTPTTEMKSALTPTSEMKSALTPTTEVKSALTPTTEIKSSLTPTSEMKSALTPTPEIKSSVSPTTEIKSSLTPTTEMKSALTPTTEMKSALTPTTEMKSALTPTTEMKSALTPTTEMKSALTPTTEIRSAISPTIEMKSALTPTNEMKSSLTPTSEMKSALTPTSESKNALTPTPESPKPTTPEPITNGTPEPGPDQADIIEGSAPKAAPPKTPEVELKPSGPALEASKDGAVAEDSTTTTTT